MWEGAVVSIHIAREAGGPMIGIDPALAVAGRGLEGDRYHDGRGFYSDHPGPIREVSLIEEETIEALRRDHNLALTPAITRRNILRGRLYHSQTHTPHPNYRRCLNCHRQAARSGRLSAPG
jgi:MOSC domain-containing protein YiiM